ncbi:MAG TPA: outer membrane lipoprotein-sorting protein [Acidobacteriota bacterium]
MSGFIERISYSSRARTAFWCSFRRARSRSLIKIWIAGLRQWRARAGAGVGLVACLCAGMVQAGDLSLGQIVAQMVMNNQERDEAMAGYSSLREYRAGSGTEHKAQMHVRATYNSPATKDFQILAEDGSIIIRSKVFRAALAAEKEALRLDQRRRIAITPENYDFALVGKERLRGHDCYVLGISPKRKEKFLISGSIWVDGSDFGVVRIKGQLAKSPSLLVRQVDFQRDYRKINGFWVPDRDESISKLLILGRSTFTVAYQNYKVRQRLELAAAGAGSATR